MTWLIFKRMIDGDITLGFLAINDVEFKVDRLQKEIQY